MEIEEWLPYIDEYGLLQDKIGGSTGNGIMYSVYLALLSEEIEIPAVVEHLKEALEGCWVPNGGMNRAPEGYYTTYAGALNQADDYIGLGLLDVILGTTYSKRVLSVSRLNWGIVNNVEPGKFLWKAFIFRMPQVRAHLKLAAGETLNPLDALLWSLSCLWSLFKLHHRDSRVKAWIMVETARRTAPQHPLINLVCDIWSWRFGERFDGVGHAEYFPMEHPARYYFWDRMPSDRLR